MHCQQSRNVVLIAEAFLLLVSAAVRGVAVLRKDVDNGFVISHNLRMLADEAKPLPVLAPQVWCDALKTKARMFRIPTKQQAMSESGHMLLTACSDQLHKHHSTQNEMHMPFS